MSTTENPLKGQSVDAAIFSNLLFSCLVGTVLFTSFCFLRRIFKDRYAANIINPRSKKVSSRVTDGWLRWISSVLQMTDDETLPWVGLDGFIYLQTIKLILGILVMLVIPALFILIPVYFLSSASVGSKTIFLRISAMNISNHSLYWVTLFFNYYLTIVVFYGLYTFFRNLSAYRQAYLYNPSSSVSQISMRRLAKSIGGLESARKLIDISSKSVIVTNVSAKYTKQDLINMFAAMDLGDISSMVIVQNRSKVKSLLERRNKSIEEFEADSRLLYNQLLVLVAADKKLSTKDTEKQYQDKKRIPLSQRESMLRMLISDKSILAEYRPVGKDNEELDAETIDNLSVHYAEVIRHDDELLQAANQFAADNERYMTEEGEYLNGNGNGHTHTHRHRHHSHSHSHGHGHGEAGVGVTSPTTSNTVTSDSVSDIDLLVSGKAVVSWAQFLDVKRNVKDYGLTLWGTSMSIIVTFQSQRSATISQQALLSSRPFSMEAFAAPTADDIIWDNLFFPQGDRFIRRLAVNVLYVVVNILFTSASGGVAALLKVDKIAEKVPFLSRLFNDYPKLPSVLQGIVAPLFYNLFLVLAPYMLYGLSIFQGKISKTKVQESLLEKLTWLLFIQSFIMLFFSTALVSIIEKLVGGQYGEILQGIREYLPEFAAFFMNIILQRAFISLMVALISPGGLILLLLNRMIWRKNVRKQALASEPNQIFIGAFYPEYIILVFMITLAFLPLTPIIGIAGLAFYFISYLVFKYHFIFTYEIPHESGAMYWLHVPKPFLVGCLLSQSFSVIHFAFEKGVSQALCMAPLMIMTVGAIVFIQSVFNRRAQFMGLSQEATERAHQLANRMKTKQTEVLKAVTMEAGEDISFLDEQQQEIGEGTSVITDGISSSEYQNSIAPGASDEGLTLGLRNCEIVPYDFGEPQSSRFLTNVEDDAFRDLSARENPYCNPILFKRHPFILLPSCFFHILQDALDIAKSGTDSHTVEVGMTSNTNNFSDKA